MTILGIPTREGRRLFAFGAEIPALARRTPTFPHVRVIIATHIFFYETTPLTYNPHLGHLRHPPRLVKPFGVEALRQVLGLLRQLLQ